MKQKHSDANENSQGARHTRQVVGDPTVLAVAAVFIIMLPIAMLNGTYTGSMVEVSNTLGVYTEDITIGYYAASAGMAVAIP